MKKTEKPDKERKTIRFRSFSSSVESKTQKYHFPPIFLIWEKATVVGCYGWQLNYVLQNEVFW